MDEFRVFLNQLLNIMNEPRSMELERYRKLKDFILETDKYYKKIEEDNQRRMKENGIWGNR